MNEVQKKKLLIIEDEHALIDLLASQFASEQIEVLKAHTLDEGLEKIESHQPNLVLTDLLLDNDSGIKLIEKVRANPASAQTKFIVLTNSTASEHIAEAMEQGVVAFLKKADMDPAQIHETVMKYL